MGCDAQSLLTDVPAVPAQNLGQRGKEKPPEAPTSNGYFGLDIKMTLSSHSTAAQGIPLHHLEIPPAIDLDEYTELPPPPLSDQPPHPDDIRDTPDDAPARQSRGQSAGEIILQFREAIEAAGIAVNGALIADGKLHRINVIGDHKWSRNAYYVLYLDGKPAGAAGDYKRGIKIKWSAKGTLPLTREDRRDMAAKIKADRVRRAAEEREANVRASGRANAIWDAGMPAGDDHPYLARKGVPSFGLRVGDWPREWHDGDGVVYQHVPNALLVPIRGEGGTIYSLQAIFADATHLARDKDFLPGGRKQGLYYVIGKPRPDDAGIVTVIICEGYSTGASIHMATGEVVIVAFDAGNLVHVARVFRAAVPAARILIAGDNDAWTDKNPGAKYGMEAAADAAVGGAAIFPRFKDVTDRPTDFNDLHRLEGLDEVKRQIEPPAAVEPTIDPAVAKAIAMLEPVDDAEVDAATDAEESKLADADWRRDRAGKIYKDDQYNIGLALKKLGVEVTHDEFAHRDLCQERGADKPRHLDDKVLRRIWLNVDKLYRFKPSKDFFWDVVQDLALQRSFHPVRDYLESLTWDGKPRIDRWLTIYGGVQDDEYTRAVGALALLGAVRRVRQPGCKFDEMLMLITEEQGKNKSTALRILAGDAWFSDSFPLDADDKVVIEQTGGKWIIEAAELRRMSDDLTLKGLLSKQVDLGRPAYGRTTQEVPRQFIIIGTTNKAQPLIDPTGGRRFWPIDVDCFNVDDLRRDRDQLWAEAAHREAQGVSIRLPQNLWALAGKHQEAHRAQDPWDDLLGEVLGKPDDDNHLCGKILSEEFWLIVGFHDRARRSPKEKTRLADAVRRLGFKKPNASGQLRFDGKNVTCYVRGNEEAHQYRIAVSADGRSARIENGDARRSAPPDNGDGRPEPPLPDDDETPF